MFPAPRRLAILEADYLAPNIIAQSPSIGSVDLDQIAAWVANVKLHLAARKFAEKVAHGFGVVQAPIASCSKDRLEIVDGKCEVVVSGSVCVPDREMQLQVADPQPLHGESKVRGIDRLCSEYLDVEADGLRQVLGRDAHMVDVRAGH
jgi:hypothetical protein